MPWALGDSGRGCDMATSAGLIRRRSATVTEYWHPTGSRSSPNCRAGRPRARRPRVAPARGRTPARDRPAARTPGRRPGRAGHGRSGGCGQVRRGAAGSGCSERPRHYSSITLSDTGSRGECAQCRLTCIRRVTASIRFGGFRVMIALVWACLSLLPVPGSCRVLRAGGRVKGRVAPACGAAGVLDATARGRIMPGGRQGALVVDVVERFGPGGLSVRGDQRDGRGRARSSQPYLGPRGCGCCPGDMMIDRVSPACGDAAAQSNQAVRLAR
jgi:hypothetical protein